MLHPSQFQPDEAWIVFRLNDVPVRTEEDGSFNVVAMMDAASCFIFGAEFVAVDMAEPPQSVVRRLIQNAKKRSRKLPATLYLPKRQFERVIVAEAERLGISAVRVEESELLPFIGEARTGFSEHLASGGGK